MPSRMLSKGASKSNTALGVQKKRLYSRKKQWSQESMIAAIKNGQGVTAAAKLHNVPKPTLQDTVAMAPNLDLDLI